MNREFKFGIGDSVKVYDGWELPITSGIVKNRRAIWKNVIQGITLVKEYGIIDDTNGSLIVYEEEALRGRQVE